MFLSCSNTKILAMNRDSKTILGYFNQIKLFQRKEIITSLSKTMHVMETKRVRKLERIVFVVRKDKKTNKKDTHLRAALSQASGVSTAGRDSIVRSKLSRTSSSSSDWPRMKDSGLSASVELSKLPLMLVLLFPELRRTIVSVPCAANTRTFNYPFVFLILMLFYFSDYTSTTKFLCWS